MTIFSALAPRGATRPGLVLLTLAACVASYAADATNTIAGKVTTTAAPASSAAAPPASAPAKSASQAASAVPAKPTSQAASAAPSKAASGDQLPMASGNPMAEKIRAAMAGTVVASRKMTVTVENKSAPLPAATGASALRAPTSPSNATARALASSRYGQARAAAIAGPGAPAAQAKGNDTTHAGDVSWGYEGANGPQAWGKLKPDFSQCANGKRQSPIPIETGNTLQGPAEPVQFAYQPSNASVVNNGHTIQVDVQGENTITVRSSSYRLVELHFHTPSEEQLNLKRFPMVAHLTHKNSEGQLAVVAVLLDEGEANPLIDKVWTYMPLDKGDRVRMPQGLLNLTELLPTDQRYYQFMGSLTTPPCSEGVLWLVLKQPVTISGAQYKLFTQLYPSNARPVQPLNGRPVREAL